MSGDKSQTTKGANVQAIIMIPAVTCLLSAIVGLVGVFVSGTVNGFWGYLSLWSIGIGGSFAGVAGWTRDVIEGNKQ